ncbi:testis-specific serine/threonine-protein kinase 4-like [Oppia nitens]|uniref:testis-specific serine/threonine-protein kinase 4-like n=1 Tax=Oppia nitens TaxID=1686743 RepID=UPI0023DBA7D6|nr:testis-specific serine/threonine-protein kinase 4-like [Oppia nitens]
MAKPEVETFDDKTTAVLKRKGYKILQSLSAGAFGQVYKAMSTKDNELVAVKVMNLEKCSEKFKEKFLPREMAAMIEVQHQNIIQVYDIFRSNRRIFIFMEFAGNGDIAHYLKKNGVLTEEKAYIWFSQVADGLNYLHTEVHLAHRDIKIDNILLNDQNVAKLTDFGFAKVSWDQNTNEVTLSETFCGTEPYYSPQIVMKQKYDPFMADCWAMGVVLFAMLNNKFPFHFGKKYGPKGMIKEQEDPNHLINRFIKDFSKHLKELIERLLDPQEKSRMSMRETLGCKWFKEKGKCTCR